jgi:hypothetical protein
VNTFTVKADDETAAMTYLNSFDDIASTSYGKTSTTECWLEVDFGADTRVEIT